MMMLARVVVCGARRLAGSIIQPFLPLILPSSDIPTAIAAAVRQLIHSVFWLHSFVSGHRDRRARSCNSLPPTHPNRGWFCRRECLNNRGLVTGQGRITCPAGPDGADLITVFHVITGFPTTIHRIGQLPGPQPRPLEAANHCRRQHRSVHDRTGVIPDVNGEGGVKPRRKTW
jgi:hypothetical protein